MYLSTYITHLTVILRLGITFDYKSGKINYFQLLWQTMSCCSVVISNIWIAREKGIKHELLTGQVYGMFLCLYFISHVPILLKSKKELSLLLENLFHPLDYNPKIVRHSEIIKEFVRWINIFGNVLLINNFFVLCVIIMVLGPLLLLPSYPHNSNIEDLPLPMGKIPFHTESYWVYAFAYLLSASAILSVGGFYTTWYIVMIFSSLKIKSHLQFISHRLMTLDEEAAQMTAVFLEHNRISQRWIGREHLTMKCASRIIDQCIIYHQKIIRYVKLVDQTFRLSLYFFVQFATIVAGLLIYQLIENKNQTVKDNMISANMAFGSMFSIGVHSLCGQIIITESLKLNWALYACNWLDKPRDLQRTLLVMMTVTRRPLCITLGSMYPLSMPSFTSTCRAVYSLINFLLTMRTNNVRQRYTSG